MVKQTDKNGKLFLDSNLEEWYHAKPINPNQEKIDEIDRQIAELTKKKEELL